MWYGRNIVLCDTGIDIGIARESTFYPSFLPPFLTPRFYTSYGRNIVLCDTGIDIGIAGEWIDILTLVFTPRPPFLTPHFYPSYGRNIVLCDTGIDIGIASEWIDILPLVFTPILNPSFLTLVMGGILYFAILISISVSPVKETTFYPSLPLVFIGIGILGRAHVKCHSGVCVFRN